MKRGIMMTLLLAFAVSCALFMRPFAVRASDHDDGETQTKARNVSLTDLYVFREVDQQNQIDGGARTFGGATDPNKNMVFVMNLNPRSLPRQQYYFANAPVRYSFNVTKVSGQPNSFGNKPTGVPDFALRFTFGAPDANSQQTISMQKIFTTNGVFNLATSTSVSAGVTTAAVPGLGNPSVVANSVTVGQDQLTVFGGLREDPFFFDVTQYFRVRAGAAGLGPAVGFRSPTTAIDFTKDYNCISLVVRMPLIFLQRNADGTASAHTAFDVWETIETQQ